jgi:hypothetical protein
MADAQNPTVCASLLASFNNEFDIAKQVLYGVYERPQIGRGPVL